MKRFENFVIFVLRTSVFFFVSSETIFKLFRLEIFLKGRVENIFTDFQEFSRKLKKNGRKIVSEGAK